MSKYKDSCEFARRLTSTKLECGKSLRELTDYGDIAMWWFAHFDFIDFLLGMPEEGGDYNPKGLRFQAGLTKLPLLLFASVNFCFDLARKLFIKSVLALYGKSEPDAPARGPRILFTSEDLMWRELRDYETGQVRKTDVFFDSLIRLLRDKEDFDLVGTYPLVKYVYPFRSAIQRFRIVVEKVKNWDVRHRPFNLYWKTSISRREYGAAREFKKIWETLAQDAKLRQLCEFNGTDIFELVRRKLAFYFLVLFPYALKRIEMSKRMLECQQPDLVLLINEYGIFERSLLIAAKTKGIPTMAIQHGNITPSHQGYMYHSEEVSVEALITSPYNQLPDKMAVFGPYFKELLTKTSSYPPDSVFVTGQPRYDILDTLKKRYSREDILGQYEIDAGRKAVLWTTQCPGLTDDDNIKNFKAMRMATDKLGDVVFVIKQHPNEGPKYTEMIEKYIGLPRDNVVLVSKTADTLCLIHACDAMITQWSTTAIEALALETNLIILNLGSDPDKVEYVKEGVALGAYTAEELATAVEKAVNNSADMAEKREKYVEQYLYRIDGKATERAAEMIKQLLKDSQSAHKGESI